MIPKEYYDRLEERKQVDRLEGVKALAKVVGILLAFGVLALGLYALALYIGVEYFTTTNWRE